MSCELEAVFLNNTCTVGKYVLGALHHRHNIERVMCLRMCYVGKGGPVLSLVVIDSNLAIVQMCGFLVYKFSKLL